MEQIEVLGPPVEEVVTHFETQPYDGNTQRDAQLRRGADCVAHYRAQQDGLANRFDGRLLALFDGEVLWDGPDVAAMMRLERESGRGWENAPQLMMRCVPPEAEVEQFHWYEAEANNRVAV